MTDVFISYSQKERDVAFRACAALEPAGLSCWIAPRDIPPGSDWADCIPPAIEGAELIVLIFSQASNQSKQVQREIHLSQSGKGKPIIPMRVEPTEPSGTLQYLLAGVQWLDAVGRLDSALEELPDRVRRMRSAADSVSAVAKFALSLIGRDLDLTAIRDLLIEKRFVTVTGTGGVGKTAIARALMDSEASRFTNSWFIDLSPFQDSQLVVPAIGSALGGAGTVPDITSRFEAGSSLLVLDNCEHVVDAVAPLIGQLVKSSPNLRIVCTSRRPIQIDEETIYRLEPLASPDAKIGAPTIEELNASPAARLLLERVAAGGSVAIATDTARAAVKRICERLDGVPLALELAAARARVLSFEDIAGELDRRFELLTKGSRDAAPYHRTLRQVIAWSVDAMSAEFRDVLGHLSILRGRFSRKAAAAASGKRDIVLLDALQELFDSSLLTVSPDESGEPLYRLLESIREFATELPGDDNTETVRRLIDYAIEVPKRSDDQEAMVRYVEREIDVVRDALHHSFAEARLMPMSVQLVEALGGFWQSSGRWSEGLLWFDRALNELNTKPMSDRDVPFLLTASNLALMCEDFVKAEALAKQALSLVPSDNRGLKARAINSLAAATVYQDRPAEAERLWLECLDLFGSDGPAVGRAHVESNLAYIAWQVNRDTDKAAKLYEASLDSARLSGTKDLVALALVNLSEISFELGRYDEALERAREAEALATALGHVSFVNDARILVAKALIGQSDLRDAYDSLQKTILDLVRLGDLPDLGEALTLLIEAVDNQESDAAIEAFGVGLCLRRATSRPLFHADQLRIDARQARIIAAGKDAIIKRAEDLARAGTIEPTVRAALSLPCATKPQP